MSRDCITDTASRASLNKIAQDVIDIFDAEDGASFEDKKRSALSYLRQIEKDSSSDNSAAADSTGEEIKARFWDGDDTFSEDGSLVLKKATCTSLMISLPPSPRNLP